MADTANQVPTEFCSNCNQNIAAAIYVLHSANCAKYMQVCPKCNETVPRKEFDEHMEEFHTQVSCEQCNKNMESWQLNSHKAECLKRLEPCQYCEITISLDKLKEHENYCGSRSELCQDCEEHVLIKDQKFHYLSCAKDRRQKVRCSNDILYNSSSDESYRSTSSCTSSLGIGFWDAKDTVIPGNRNNRSSHLSLKTKEVHTDEHTKGKQCIHCDEYFEGSGDVCRECSSSFQNTSSERLSSQQSSKTDFCESKFGSERGNSNISRREEAKNLYTYKNCNKPQEFKRDEQGTKAKEYMNSYNDVASRNRHSNNGYASDNSRRQKTENKCSSCRTYLPSNISGTGNICPTCYADIPDPHSEEQMPQQPRKHNESENIAVNSLFGNHMRSNNRNDRGRNFIPQRDNRVSKEDLSSQPKNWKDMEKFFRENKQCSKEVLEMNPMCIKCGERFPMNIIDDHMQICPSRDELCPICNQCFPLDSIEKHVNLCIEINEKHCTSKDEPEPMAGKNLSKKQKRKIAKRKKTEAQKEAVQYLASQSRDEFINKTPRNIIPKCSSPSKTLVGRDDLKLPCEFCNELIPAQHLIQHESGCRPDLLSYPQPENAPGFSHQNEDSGYAISLPPFSSRNTTNSQIHKRKGTGSKIICTVENIQNAQNKAIENMQTIESSADVRKEADLREMTSKSETELNQCSSEESESSVTMCSRLEMMSISPAPIVKQSSNGNRFLMRGRGRGILNAIKEMKSADAACRPGEFLQNSHQRTVHCDSADSTPSTFEKSAKSEPKKLCIANEDNSNKVESGVYKFQPLPSNSCVKDVVDNLKWKVDYSNNLLPEKETMESNKIANLEAKIPLISTSSKRMKDLACNEHDAAEENSGHENNSASIKSDNAQGASFRFTAASERVTIKKRPPYAIQNLRRPLMQSKFKSNR